MLKRRNTFDITVDVLMVVFGIIAIASAIYGVSNYHNLGIVFGCIAVSCIGLLMLLEGCADLYYRLKER